MSVSSAVLATSCDWSATDLGPRSEWLPTITHIIAALLEAPAPVCYMHGPRFAMVYNDAFSVLLGDKHPAAWGRPAAEVVSEVWDNPGIGPVFEELLATGKPFLEEGTLLNLDRGRGTGSAADDGFYLRAGSAVRDESGDVVGVLHLVVETTQGVQRMKAVADLATSLAAAVTVDDVTKVALHYAVSSLGAREAVVCMPAERVGDWSVSRRQAGDLLSPGEERLPLIWSDLEDDDEAIVRKVAEGGPRHVGDDLVVLPLRTGTASGAVALRLVDPVLPAADLEVLLTFAELVAGAVGRARLFDRERMTAELLQRTLLPQVLPQSGDFTVAARYEPVASGGAVAGGDFYDAFNLQDGRLAVVIGDVIGVGVSAATVMGQVRSAARGAALTDPDPATVLSGLDRLVSSLDEMWPGSTETESAQDPRGFGFGGELFVTMLYGVLDPKTGELTMASAGHYPPAVLRAHPASTQASFVDLETGPPLGVGGRRPVHTMELAEGDLLLAFTDGLVERRSRPLEAAERDLLSALDELSSWSPRGLCQYVIERMTRDGFEDDCALLAVGRTRAVRRTASLVVPPVPRAVKQARDWVREQMVAWCVGEDVEFAAVMGVSELVTNVILHAATDAWVALDLDDNRLLVTVSDSGSRGAPRLAHDDLVTTRGRGLGLVSSIADSFGAHRNAIGSTVWFEVSVVAADVR